MCLRVAIGGIHIESSTFTSYISSQNDFRITKGKELLKSYNWLYSYQDTIELIPIMNARAIPGGVVARSFLMIG